ncbi:hypothetical protein CALCODRAFT_516728 [Calocera cornea HHB12733]|uniref:Uncharacterized protein n=1 Tax=Calocera cornea HHB12733 TaxID=1353952 RepID=A0A165GV37_9BASI|nr:hypothetical protein CALCODRAFT_516728 [Calocera cornea HHB12733]
MSRASLTCAKLYSATVRSPQPPSRSSNMGLMDLFNKVVDSVEADVKAATMYGKIAVAGVHDLIGNEAESRAMIQEVQNDGGMQIIQNANQGHNAVVQEGKAVVQEVAAHVAMAVEQGKDLGVKAVKAAPRVLEVVVMKRPLS